LPQEWIGINLTTVEDPFYSKTLIISFWISMLTLLVAGTGLLKTLFSNKASTKKPH
jgi:hypothetical protein